MATNRTVLKAQVVLSAVDKMSGVVNRAMIGAENRLNKVSRRSDEIARKSANFARQAGATGVAIGAALAVPVKKAIEFEHAIGGLGAVSNATDADLARMSKTAKQMGRETQFSAMQSAEAMGFLAMAGFDAEQNIAAIPNVLNLSAAGAVDLARAADISSNIMSGFNKEATDLAHINDVLANTFTNSNTTLDSLGKTMEFAAPIAASLKIPIEQVAAMAGKLGDAGLQGEKGGTGLRSMMLRLSAPMKKGRRSLDELGVSTLDAAGNLRNMPELLAEIGNKIKALPTGKQAEVLKNVFGTEGSSAASALLVQARTGELQKFITKVGVAGTAAAVAEKRMNTGQGALLRWQSATEGLAISIGNVLLPPITELALKGAKIAARIEEWTEKNPRLTSTIVKTAAGLAILLTTASAVGFLISGVATAVGTAAKIFMFLSKAIRIVGVAIRIVGIIMAANPIGLVVAAIALGATLIIANWTKVKTFFLNLWPQIKTVGAALVKGFAGFHVMMVKAGVGIITGIITGIKKKAAVLVNTMKGVAQKVRDFLPFSPAKVGPLKDLNRIKLIETIAQTITPKPLVNAMGNVMGAAVQPIPVSSGGGGGGGGISVNFSPTINFAGGSPDEQTRNNFMEMLRSYEPQLLQLIDEAMRKRQRSKF